MLKHKLSPVPLPEAKRLHTGKGQVILSTPLLNFDSSLYDELILVIFSYLSWTDLCAIQPTNRLWARLASDNQLWKEQFVREYGRLRLRGSRGFNTRYDGCEIKPLPHTSKLDENDSGPDHIDWKRMFRISLNWRRGRCQLERYKNSLDSTPNSGILAGTGTHRCTLLAGSLAITSAAESSVLPRIYLYKHGAIPYALEGKLRDQTSTHITALALNQSPPSSVNNKVRVVALYDNGDFSIFSVDESNPQHSRLLLTYRPRSKTDRTVPIRQVAYHHPLLVTLSQSFKLSLYNLSDDGVVHTQTLSSFSSYPPTSMVLTSGLKNYKLVLAYSAPVFPSEWGAAVTVLTISRAERPAQKGCGDAKPCTVIATRTARAFDVPSGWIDDVALRSMRDQWGRRAARVADVQTDGKWLVLAPADRLPLPHSSSPTSSSSFRSSRIGTTACVLQLYRLYIPPESSSSSSNGLRLAFVRYLHGHTGPVVSLAVADGRCVSRGSDGSLWVWDLERGWGVDVQTAHGDPTLHSRAISSSSGLWDSSSTSVDGSTSESEDEKVHYFPNDEVPMGILLSAVAFDERRIVTADAYGVELRSFDI